MQNICVFLSSNTPEDKYRLPAIRFAEILGKKGHRLVWGGANMGLMGDVAHVARKHGAYLSGVIIERLKDYAFVEIDVLFITPDISKRKEVMLDMSGAFVVLPGGIGTLDEFIHVVEMKKGGSHNKPIVVLNTEGFFDPILRMFENISREGFYKRDMDDLVKFVSEPEEIFEYLESYKVLQ